MVAIKHIYKDKLLDDVLKRQALLECQVHTALRHDQIVELYECVQTE